MKGRVLLRLAAPCLIAVIFCVQTAAAGTHLVGSGASFPYQIYSLWFMLFGRADKNIQIDYEPKGSGGGSRIFRNILSTLPPAMPL